MTALYCVDTSSYIRAWHEAYPPDVVPSFWDRMDKAMKNGRIISPEEVLREVGKRSDDLRAWLHARRDCFADIDDELQDAVAEVLAATPLLAKNRKGASSADAWVIALARLRGAAVVSEESEANHSAKRPRIPGVCRGIGVACVPLLDFMRAEKWRL